MEKVFSSIIILFVVVTLYSCAPSAVVVRPAPPIVVRPIQPSPNHIWVSGNYVRRNGRYVYTNGYWAAPAYGRSRWIDGHWKTTRRGYVWVPGRWR